MKLRLLLACLVASSMSSLAFGDLSAPSGNPKTARKPYAKPASQVTRVTQGGSAKNQQSGTTLGNSPSAAGGILGVAAIAPPPNDDCNTPTVLTTASGSNVFPFNNTMATTGSQGQTFSSFGCADPTYGNYYDVWFWWKAQWTTTATIQTCGGSPLDTKITVYPGAGCPSSAFVGCNDDDAGCTPQSKIVNMPVTAGVDYMIQIGSSVLLRPGSSPSGGGRITGPGNFEIIIFAPPPAPPEDDCATPAVAILGANPYDTTGCTTGSEGQVEAICDFAGQIGIEKDAWYTWTDSGAGGCTWISTCGGVHDSKLAVYGYFAPGCPTSSAIACSDDACGLQSAVSFFASPGASYKIQLGSFPSAPGATGTMLITQVPTGAGNDDCAAPAVAITGVNPYDNSGATSGCEGQTESRCARESGPAIFNDLWYTWTAPAGIQAYALVTTCGYSTDDTKIAVYAGAGCPAGSALVCRDDSCGTQTTIIFPYDPGATYTIQIGNSSGTTGGAGNAFEIALVDRLACDPWDDGATEYAGGAFGPNDYAWLNRFGAPNITTTINSVDIAYGAAFSPLGVPAGTPTDIWIWQDGPSQDGDPTDAELIWTEPVTMTSVSTDVLDNYALSNPVSVTGIFFVGTHCYNPNGIIPSVSGYTVAFDTTAHDWPEVSWMFRADGTGAVADAFYLGNSLYNTVTVHSAEAAGIFGQCPIRVNCSSGPTNTCCQPGIGLTTSCPCTNPPGARERGCNNKDATGGARLTAIGTASLSAPLATTLVFTSTGQNNIGSQTSLLMQGKVLTNGIPFGHGVKCFGAFLRVYNHSGAPWIGPPGTFTAPIAPDLTIPMRSAAAGQPIPVGAPRYYQVYYRDNVNMLPAISCSIASSKQNVSDGQWCFWGP